ncbi:MAG: L-fucose/L-arabinose isomerase family protein [Candidatus Geothermincolia bacterium]
MAAPIKIGFVPASRGMFDQQLAVSVRDACVDAMRTAGIDPVVPTDGMTKNGLVQTAAEAEGAARLFEGEDVAGIVVGALNFGEEIPAAIAATRGGSTRPLMIFGVGEEGMLTRDTARRDAFCGLISIATALRHREAKFVFPRRAICYPEDSTLVNALAEFKAACLGVRAVRGAVYGQFGPRPANFETCAFDELSLMRKLGTRVVPVPLTTVFARAEYAPERRVRATYADMEKSVDRTAISDLDLAKLARLEVVLEDMVEEHALDGLALQCWTSIQQDYGISPCFVLARLTERGIPCACEVDMHGTVSMHLLSAIAGAPAGLADWNNRHVTEPDVFSAWHCGVFPPSFGGACRIGHHNILAGDTGTTDGKYGTLELGMDAGPVTMARVTEHPWDEWPVLLAEGEVVDAPGEPFGGNGWVKVEDLDSLYAAILRGFPHHTAIARGRHGAALLAASYFLDLEPVAPLGLEQGNLELGPEY